MDFESLYIALTVFMSLLIATSYADNDIDCPENCTCNEIDTLICKNVDYVPLYADRPGIHVLSIMNHTITSLTLVDFVNFTKLSYLTLTVGRIDSLTDQSFMEIRSTITRIDLSHNHIKTIEPGTFSNFTELNNLVLNYNELSVLEAGLFTDVPKLVTVKFEFNVLTQMKPDVFKNAPILENLNLYSNKFTEIPWDGMRGLSGLKQLHISNNKIGSVGEHTQVYLDSLEDIILSNNPLWSIVTFPNVSMSLKTLNMGFTYIEYVNNYTWQHVPELESLYLDGTRFCEIYDGMFDGLSSLKNLYMTDMDYLTAVGPRSFRYSPNMYSVDLSRNKKLNTIHEDAFADSKVTVVKMMDCGVTSFPQNMLPWEDMLHVHIAPNPINCDCNAKWMSDSSIYGNATDIPSLRCELPESLASHRVTSLSPESFVCVEPIDHRSRFAVGMICAIVVIVVVVTFALVFKFRHKITMSCRRYFMYRRYRNDMIFTVENDTSVAELDDTEARPLKEVRLETVPLDENA